MYKLLGKILNMEPIMPGDIIRHYKLCEKKKKKKMKTEGKVIK